MQIVVVAGETKNGITLELPSEFEIEPGTRLEVTRSGNELVLTPLPPEPETGEPYTLETIQAEVTPIAQNNDVHRIWLYGACAQKDVCAGSIIRFLVEPEDHGNLDDILPDLVRAFQAPVQVVDIRDKDKIPDRVLGEPKLIYETIAS